MGRNARRYPYSLASRPAPGPVSDDWVNETSHTDAVKKVAHEPSAADHGSGGNSRACIGEGELEDPHREESHSRGFIGGWRVLQEKPVITDETVAVGEHKREADGVEQNAAKAGVHYALDENVHGFTRPAEAGFEHGEADLHTEHEN